MTALWNADHAQTVANDWLQKNPGHVWRGEWRNTVPGQRGQIDVYQRVGDLSV